MFKKLIQYADGYKSLEWLMVQRGNRADEAI